MNSTDNKLTELEWTNDQIINLIKEYKKRPTLWDPKHPHCRVQTAKYEAWCELAEIFECEIADIKKKFNSIFASHRREKAKVRIGGRSSWFLYNELSFLPTHITYEDAGTPATKVRKKKAAEEENAETSDEFDDNSRHSPINVMIKEEPEISEKNIPKIQYPCSKPRLTRILKRRLVKETERPSILDRKFYKRGGFYKKKDECDSFGDYIAMSLRKHDERTRSMIKQAINNILFEQEMKKYNSSGSQYVVISAVEENPLVSE